MLLLVSGSYRPGDRPISATSSAWGTLHGRVLVVREWRIWAKDFRHILQQGVRHPSLIGERLLVVVFDRQASDWRRSTARVAGTSRRILERAATEVPAQDRALVSNPIRGSVLNDELLFLGLIGRWRSLNVMSVRVHCRFSWARATRETPIFNLLPPP